jgi:hypothetical protein
MSCNRTKRFFSNFDADKDIIRKLAQTLKGKFVQSFRFELAESVPEYDCSAVLLHKAEMELDRESRKLYVSYDGNGHKALRK